MRSSLQQKRLQAMKADSSREPLMELTQALGTTSRWNSALSNHPHTPEIAFAAGAVVVLYDPVADKQTGFLSSASGKPVSCLAHSPDGKLLAVGESGKQPAVLVWDLAKQQVVATLLKHKHGVAAMAWAPAMKHLVSVGVEYDGNLCV